MTAGWLDDVRTSYDTVVDGYVAMFPDGLANHPQVRAELAMFAELAGDVEGPVLDAGCGVGLLVGPLRERGLDVFGVDISPGMLAVARRNHPGVRFEEGSMTELDVPDASCAGVLAYYSVHHVPDAEVPAVFAHFHRVLRPGGVTMVGFHVGDEYRFKTQGYGGYPTRLHINLRPVARVSGWLREAGFTIEAELTSTPDEPVPGGVVVARKPR